jgi:hypothetical protein
MADGYVARFGHQPLTLLERNGLPNPFDGQVIYNLDREFVEIYHSAHGVWLSHQQVKGTNESGVVLSPGQPVIPSGSSIDGYTLTSDHRDLRIAGIVVDGDLTPGGKFTVAITGDWPVLISGSTTIGQFLGQSTTQGVAIGLGSQQGAFAMAREAVVGPGPGLVTCTLQPTSRTDQSPPYNPRAPTQVTLTSSSGQPYIQSTSGTYEVIAQFAWPGTSDMSLPFQILAALSMNGGDSMDIRVFDATNVQIIAELLGYTTPTFTVVDLGTVSNVPATPAIWEIQIRGNGTGRKARAASVVFLPPTS